MTAPLSSPGPGAPRGRRVSCSPLALHLLWAWLSVAAVCGVCVVGKLDSRCGGTSSLLFQGPPSPRAWTWAAAPESALCCERSSRPAVLLCPLTGPSTGALPLQAWSLLFFGLIHDFVEASLEVS